MPSIIRRKPSVNFHSIRSSVTFVNHILKRIESGRANGVKFAPWLIVRIRRILSIGMVVGVTATTDLREDRIDIPSEDLVEDSIAIHLGVQVPGRNIHRTKFCGVDRKSRERYTIKNKQNRKMFHKITSMYVRITRTRGRYNLPLAKNPFPDLERYLSLHVNAKVLTNLSS